MFLTLSAPLCADGVRSAASGMTACVNPWRSVFSARGDLCRSHPPRRESELHVQAQSRSSRDLALPSSDVRSSSSHRRRSQKPPKVEVGKAIIGSSADMRSEMLGSFGGRRLRVVKSRYRDLRIVLSDGARMFRPSRHLATNVTVGSEDGSHQHRRRTSKVWRSCGGSRPGQVPEFACLWRCGAWFAIGGPCRLELLTRISAL